MPVDVFRLTTELFGGLAIFLLGMQMMAEALEAVAGERMKGLLSRLTRNRLSGVLTGAVATAVIQSSSVTTVLVVGFISAGLMSMSQSIGVIMGANIGTTVTAQVIAFKVTEYALLMVAVGFGASFVGRRERVRKYGTALLGLGLIFLGMAVMADAMHPLRSYPPFIDLMTRMEQPALGILVGAVFTALVQSSSATTGVIIVLASQGLIQLEAGIALAFGANIGTCVTALLASLGRPREALRAAVVHVLFNVGGVLVWLAFIDDLAAVVAVASPSRPDLAGVERLAAETPRQIANAHTVFNVANTLLFLPFTTQLGRLVEAMVPDRPLAAAAAVQARYLDRALLISPSLALDRVRLEILHMGNRVKAMYAAILPAMLRGDREELREVIALDDGIDLLHGMIVEYLGEISRRELSQPQTEELLRMMAAVNDVENIGDIIETNLGALGMERITQGVQPSRETAGLISELHAEIGTALDLAVMAVTQKNATAASQVIAMRPDIQQRVEHAARHGARRLVAEAPGRLPAYRVENDMVQNLNRIYYFCRRLSRAAVEPGDLQHAL